MRPSNEQQRSLRRPRVALWVVALAALCGSLSLGLLVACSQLGGLTPVARGTVVGQEHAVPLQIAKDQSGSVLAFVDVSIQDQRPFHFVLDTGASRSVINRPLAERLKLATVPVLPMAQDLSGAVQASVVRVADWRAGEVALPEGLLMSIDVQSPS